MPETSSSSAARARKPFFNTLGRALEVALNRLIDLDPETRMRITALEGRAVSIDFKSAVPSMRLAVEGDRLRIGPAFEGTSGLRVAATPASLLALALAFARGGDALAPGRVEIAGDAELARRLQQIATRFAPDFDEAFTRVFGDVIGMKVANAIRGSLAFARTSARATAQDAAEFLTEESRDLVAKTEAGMFFDDVDDLRERVDRLDASVRRISAAQRA